MQIQFVFSGWDAILLWFQQLRFWWLSIDLRHFFRVLQKKILSSQWCKPHFSTLFSFEYLQFLTTFTLTLYCVRTYFLFPICAKSPSFLPSLSTLLFHVRTILRVFKLTNMIRVSSICIIISKLETFVSTNLIRNKKSNRSQSVAFEKIQVSKWDCLQNNWLAQSIESRQVLTLLRTMLYRISILRKFVIFMCSRCYTWKCFKKSTSYKEAITNSCKNWWYIKSHDEQN